MIQSMTSFASRSIILSLEESLTIKLSISLKSLNARYFDISIKIPYIFNLFESELVKLIKEKLHRGNITLVIHSTNTDAFKTSIHPSISIIQNYLKSIKQIQEKFNIPGDISLNDILNLPHIFTLEEKNIDQNSKDVIFNTINELILELTNSRNKEGETIKQDLIHRIEIMKKNIEQTNNLQEYFLIEMKGKVSKKIFEIKELSPELLEIQRQNLYLSLDKIDIHEEISRFISHLNNLENIINSKVIEKGKQIDFVLQELSREINTITAKTSNSKIIDLAIIIKVEIEKMREQAQNIV